MNGHSPYVHAVRSKVFGHQVPFTRSARELRVMKYNLNNMHSLSHLVYNINSHWYVLPGRYLRRPFPTLKTLRSML